MISRPRKLLFSLLLFVLLSWTVFGLFQWMQHVHHDASAREKLDTLLGKDSSSADEDQPSSDDSQSSPLPGMPKTLPGQPPTIPKKFWNFSPPSFSRPFGHPLFSMPGFSNLDVGVEVQEKPDRYILRVPLLNPQDANQIKLSVRPDHIEISGQTGSHSHGVMTSSSFMQSFSTSERVSPEKVSKKTEKEGENSVLVITIPKQNPSGKSSDSQSKSSHLPFTQPEHPQIRPSEIPDDNTGSPVYGGGQHPVI